MLYLFKWRGVKLTKLGEIVNLRFYLQAYIYYGMTNWCHV